MSALRLSFTAFLQSAKQETGRICQTLDMASPHFMFKRVRIGSGRSHTKGPVALKLDCSIARPSRCALRDIL